MIIDKNKIIVIVSAALAVIFGALYFAGHRDAPVVLERPREEAPLIKGAVNEIPSTVTVHVAGEVKNPGVYQLAGGSRAQDALKLAGGPTVEADLNRVNLAAVLTDAQQLTIPKFRADNDANGWYEEADKKININTANAKELTALPGIGDVIAGNIVAYREKNGQFNQISDIKNVTRIGDRTFEQIEDLITVN